MEGPHKGPVKNKGEGGIQNGEVKLYPVKKLVSEKVLAILNEGAQQVFG